MISLNVNNSIFMKFKIIQFKKRKEFDKANEDCFLTLGESLKSLENMMKKIPNLISLDLNELEDQFKVFNEQIFLCDTNTLAFFLRMQIRVMIT